MEDKIKLIKKLDAISANVDCPHTQYEIMSFIENLFNIPKDIKGCIVEAGCYKGGSTAKFSLAAKMVNRKLVVFDSFEGLPKNSEQHGENIFGDKIKIGAFTEGKYCGTLKEVKKNVNKFGEIEVCQFIKGWFKDIMPKFSGPIVAIYLDVDLASSTRTCLKYLYPLLIPGGILYSQDGHLPLVIDVFNDDIFWKKEVGCSKPQIRSIGKKKLIKIVKPNLLK